MRHALSIFAVIGVVAIATLLFSAQLSSIPTPAAISFIGRAGDLGGQNLPRNTVAVGLDVGQYLGDQIAGFTSDQLSGLQGGVVQSQVLASSYAQVLRFKEPGVFSGGHVVFGRSDGHEVSDFLQFDDALFKLQVDFGGGLPSTINNNHLVDIEGAQIDVMGDRYVIVDSFINTATNTVVLKLFGGFGSVEFADGNYADDQYESGVKINGQQIDAQVKIRAVKSNNVLTIYAIEYLLNANGKTGLVQVLPLHCSREYLRYPQGLLSPNFDICYKGLGTAQGSEESLSVGNEVSVRPIGDDQYMLVAPNTRGRVYKIPLAQLPGTYGNKGRSFVFTEAVNSLAPNIELNSYFLVNSKDDVLGDSHVLRYVTIDTTQHVAYFEDLAGGSRAAAFDPTTNEGDLLVGEGTYHFVVGAGNALAMDLTNDGDIAGDEARFILPGGHKLDFGPGFTVSLITPQRLFDEPQGDETTTFSVLFGSGVDLSVPSPQGSVFALHSLTGHKQGLTKFGIFFDWTIDAGSDSLKIVLPGVQRIKGGQAQVFVTLERPRVMKKTDVPAPAAKCGDKIVASPEYCDPPGSSCATPNNEAGLCASTCMTCTPQPKPGCGNKLLDVGEECEVSADCKSSEECKSCKCVDLPKPVCGNKLLEGGEECESRADCGASINCIACTCVASPPQLQLPMSVPVQVQIRQVSFMEKLLGWSSAFKEYVLHSTQCASQGECRVLKNECGTGFAPIYETGVFKSCVGLDDATSVPYCAFKPGSGVHCDAQSTNPIEQLGCVCP